MAKTLLNGVNEVLKRTQTTSSSNEFTTLTSSGKQVYIDIAVQILNEVTWQLYEEAGLPVPQELATDSITLVADDRDYALASDLVQLRYPLIDQTNGDRIYEYPGGYMQMIEDQDIPSNYTGEPQLAAIDPIDGELYLDRIPTATEAGNVYTYWYDKNITLSDASDTFPFPDPVFYAVVPAAAALWKWEVQNVFNQGLFKANFGRAARLLSQKPMRDGWLPTRRVNEELTDPYAN